MSEKYECFRCELSVDFIDAFYCDNELCSSGMINPPVFCRSCGEATEQRNVKYGRNYCPVFEYIIKRNPNYMVDRDHTLVNLCRQINY